MSLVSPKAQKSGEGKSISNVMLGQKDSEEISGNRKSVSILVSPKAGIYRNHERSFVNKYGKGTREQASEVANRDSAIIRALAKESKLNEAEPRLRFKFN